MSVIENIHLRMYYAKKTTFASNKQCMLETKLDEDTFSVTEFSYLQRVCYKTAESLLLK